jgi:hypothetical protein
MTPAGRCCHVARLECRDRRLDERCRLAQRRAIVDTMSNDDLKRLVALLRRAVEDGADALSAAETAALDALFGPVLALSEADDEVPL